MRPVYRGPAPTHERIVSGGTGPVLSSEYGFFGAALGRRIGHYCSYCEVALGSSLAVEHIVSKSKYPSLETAWPNFLLACSNCNSTKGSRIEDITSLANFFWPCDTSINTAEKFKYVADSTTGTVQIAPADSLSTSDRTRATNTIALMALNRLREDDPKVADRRVQNRTNTARVALGLKQALESRFTTYNTITDKTEAKRQATADVSIRLLKEQIAAAAAATGFWSMWMNAFITLNAIDAGFRNNLLDQMFIQTFPGTNYALPDTTRVRLIDPTGLPTEF